MTAFLNQSNKKSILTSLSLIAANIEHKLSATVLIYQMSKYKNMILLLFGSRNVFKCVYDPLERNTN